MTTRTFSLAIAASTLAAAVVVVADPGAPLRVPVVLAWALIVPGLAWAPRLRLGDAGDTLIAGVVISICLLAAAAETMALLAAWSPMRAFVVLAGVALLGALFPGGAGGDPRDTADGPRRLRPPGPSTR